MNLFAVNKLNFKEKVKETYMIKNAYILLFWRPMLGGCNAAPSYTSPKKGKKYIKF